MNEIKELVQRIVRFIICFSMELGYMYTLPAAYKAGEGLWYLLLSMAIATLILVCCEYWSFTAWIAEVMDWTEDEI